MLFYSKYFIHRIPSPVEWALFFCFFLIINEKTSLCCTRVKKPQTFRLPLSPCISGKVCKLNILFSCWYHAGYWKKLANLPRMKDFLRDFLNTMGRKPTEEPFFSFFSFYYFLLIYVFFLLLNIISFLWSTWFDCVRRLFVRANTQSDWSVVASDHLTHC